MVAQAFRLPHPPIVAHIVPVRRCNLSCTYCNEFDSTSSPVPTSVMLSRIDRLAALGTGVITISGGEPLLHPELDAIIRQIRRQRIIATLITNGFLLRPERIRRLNQAGLDHLQISIDNVIPDEVSKKSLKALDRRLHWLVEYAKFDVNINSVVGSGVRNPEDALVIARRAQGLGFKTSVGVIHNGKGQLVPLSDKEQRIHDEILGMEKSSFAFTGYHRFQRNLAKGQPNQWHCRAGSRYLYICEDGLVHWCSQQRGYPGIPLERYTHEDLKRESDIPKPCAPNCTVGCVHRVAVLDSLRENPVETLVTWLTEGQTESNLPLPVRFLTWLFVTGKGHQFFREATLRLLRVK